jgi:hypothetical protein
LVELCLGNLLIRPSIGWERENMNEEGVGEEGDEGLEVERE